MATRPDRPGTHDDRYGYRDDRYQSHQNGPGRRSRPAPPPARGSVDRSGTERVPGDRGTADRLDVPGGSRDESGRRTAVRAVRARLLILLGALAAGIGVGLLLTGSLVPGLAMIAAALLLSGGGFALGVYPSGVLVRRLRQAPAVGLIGVGLVSAVLSFSAGAVISAVLGLALLVADAALARRAATGEPFRFSIPSPRSLVPRPRRSDSQDHGYSDGSGEASDEGDRDDLRDGYESHEDNRYDDGGETLSRDDRGPARDDQHDPQAQRQRADATDEADLSGPDSDSDNLTQLREAELSSHGGHRSRERSA